jgi:hypothetical protein
VRPGSHQRDETFVKAHADRNGALRSDAGGRHGRRMLLLVALAAVALLSLVIAPAALATQRFAIPNGSTTGTCAPPDPPCTLQRAVEDPQTVNWDEVIVNPGDYLEGSNQLLVDNSISLHGADGQPFARIVSSAADAVFVQQIATGALVRRLAIEHTGSGNALFLGAGTAEQIVARSTRSGCDLLATPAGTTLRDSLCWVNNAPGASSAVFVSSSVNAVSNLRNVTAIATGSSSQGIFVSGDGSGATTTVDARNVIARGGAPNADVWADTIAGATATVTLDHSNYGTQNETGAGTPSVTDPGTGMNQTSSPLFADPANGDFHQLIGSPTIDAGDAAASLLGTLDFDGEQRIVGVAPDIGADEFVPSPTAPPPVLTPPLTQPFNLAAAIKRCKKKFAKGSKARKRCIKKARARA